MKLRTAEYFIREAILSIRRNGLMSVASVSTVAVSLLILGMFLVIVLNLNNMAAELESQVQIIVYLEDKLSDEEIRAIGTRIAQMEGVRQVMFVTKDEAMARFKERLGEQQSILDALGDVNPLPNSFEIKMADPKLVKPTAEAIKKYSGVENVRYGQEIIEQLFGLTRLVRLVGITLIVFLALAAMFIISNTIRLTVFARRREIGIMKYVGATDWFIRWPFLIEGMILGFGGAFIAVMLLSKTYGLIVEQIYQSLAFLPVIPQYPFMNYVGLLLLVAGMIIGALGSTISLRRYMQV